jgi:predicted DNA-binding ribbon-helix-helix protein
MCLDPDLQDLVQDENDKDDEEGLFQTLGACFNLASMLRVACGTLLSLSLAISLPVTLQMP